MAKYTIVVVDDELPNLESIERILVSDGAKVWTFQDAHQALNHIQSHGVDILMTDLRMGALGGMELLETVKHNQPSVEVILITAYGTVQLAVEAMKKGAYDFITKPLQRLHVLKTVHRALEKKRLVSTNESLLDELNSKRHSQKMLGTCSVMRQVIDTAQKSAMSRANVMIEGESGTGKGVLAEYIHENSLHAKGLFVKINCAAIPETLLEAELFGYEAGAFTGATRPKKGRVELAEKGTLFLDEVGTAPLSIQSKLLRFVQEGEFERLGGTRTHRVDTRVISATNTRLKEAVANGTFREDLYYRLNVVHIRMPRLRERCEDIPLLVQEFLQRSARKNGRNVPLVTPETLECLTSYGWPGNIRELENLIECLVVLNQTGTILPSELPSDISKSDRTRSIVIPIGLPLRDAERVIMDETLKSTNGDKRLAAKLLRVHPRTIYRHLEQETQTETPAQEPPRSFDLAPNAE